MSGAAKREGTESYWTIPFDRHRLAKVNHSWTNGQAERMNRTIKEATVKRYHYPSHDHLKQRPHAFLMAYNFAKPFQHTVGLKSYAIAAPGQD